METVERGVLTAEIFETWFPTNPIGFAVHLINLIDENHVERICLAIPVEGGVMSAFINKMQLLRIVENLKGFK